MKNNLLCLISGEQTTGKSFGSKFLENPEGVLYFDFESKGLPYKDNGMVIVGAEKVPNFATFFSYLDLFINKDPKVKKYHTIIIDSISTLSDLLLIEISKGDPEKQISQRGWGIYSDYTMALFNKLRALDVNVIVLGATEYQSISTGADQDSKDLTKNMANRTIYKGTYGKRGIESFFNLVINTHKVTIPTLQEAIDKDNAEYKQYLQDFVYKKECQKDPEYLDKHPELVDTNSLINITFKDTKRGFKYVYKVQTHSEADVVRSPEDFWKDTEYYIDNNMQHIINRFKEYKGN